MHDVRAALFSISPWRTVEVMEHMAVALKQDAPTDPVNRRIAAATSRYEDAITELWEEFKMHPSEENAKVFADKLRDLGIELWPEAMIDILGIDDELTPDMRQVLDEQLTEHHGFIFESLLPDIVKELREGREAFNNFDFRVIFMYAGALWMFGSLATVMFDGLDMRDLADVFLFAGPNDENTCTGPDGCEQHVGKLYTVAQILAQNIIPGRFRCLTSCRHMLIPVASPLE
jgi:hypothetical protein